MMFADTAQRAKNTKLATTMAIAATLATVEIMSPLAQIELGEFEDVFFELNDPSDPTDDVIVDCL